MQNPNASTTPLMDVLPPSPCHSALLVGDSLHSDGRFVLHTIATHVLDNSNNNRVLWVAGGPYTPALVANGLKKMGCEAATNFLRQQQQQQHQSQPSELLENQRLSIRSIPAELGERFLNEDMTHHDDCDLNFEAFTKQLYGEIKDWLLQRHHEEPSASALVILDDVSAMAALLGSRLTYGLILSLQALRQKQHQPFGLALRCAQDLEQQQQILSEQASSSCLSGNSNDWSTSAAAANACVRQAVDSHDCAFEKSLVELVDWVVDVVPLTSGYAREAHGRLIISQTDAAAPTSSAPTVGISSSRSRAVSIYNYCLTDNKALAIRVQQQRRLP